MYVALGPAMYMRYSWTNNSYHTHVYFFIIRIV
jgi:hypothetical protein